MKWAPHTCVFTLHWQQAQRTEPHAFSSDRRWQPRLPLERSIRDAVTFDRLLAGLYLMRENR